MQISKIEKVLLGALYAEYLNRLSHGVPFDSANFFSNSDSVQESFCPKLSKETVADLCWHLCDRGLLNCLPGDDLANDISITFAGLAYLEQEYPQGLSQLLKIAKPLWEIFLGVSSLLKQ